MRFLSPVSFAVAGSNPTLRFPGISTAEQRAAVGALAGKVRRPNNMAHGWHTHWYFVASCGVLRCLPIPTRLGVDEAAQRAMAPKGRELAPRCRTALLGP